MGDTTFRGWPHHLPDPISEATCVVDERGVLTGWSLGAQNLLGHRAEDVVGRPVAELFAPGGPGPPRFEAHTAAGGGPAVLRHRDGHDVRTVLWAQPWSPGDGRPHWLLQATSEEAVRRQDIGRALLDGLGLASPIAMSVYDDQYRCLMQNAALRRLSGVPDEERLGLTLSETVSQVDTSGMEATQHQVLRQGVAVADVEVRGRVPSDPDRERVWSNSVFPLKDRSGEVFAVCHAVLDITERHRARERLAVLNDASARIGSTLDLLHTAQELADVAVPRLADFACVDLIDSVFEGEEPPTGAVTSERVFRRAAHRSIAPGTPEAVADVEDVDVHASAPDSPFARALATGASVLESVNGQDPVPGWLADDPKRAEGIKRWGIHSWMVVPVRARGSTLGVAVFVRRQRTDPFEQDDLLLADEIVARAAVCIDNARRYTRERGTALALQRSLLPQRLPAQAAVEARSRYLPAGSRLGVGGDWFDVIPLSGARVALVVGDVVGHGMKAAVTMGRLRTAVRTLADLDLPPDELLAHVDDQVRRLVDEQAAEGQESGDATGAAAGPPPEPAIDAWAFGATCVYAVYDPITRHLTFARAGHPPPAVVTPGGRAEFLDSANGPPLGVGGLPFEATGVQLPDHSLLVLYTDGLVESRDHDIDAGLDRLRHALDDDCRDLSLDAVCDTVVSRLIPGHPSDDVALLVARTRALSDDHCAVWDLPAEPAVVSRARAHVARQLSRWQLGHLLDTTQVVVTELLTNAIVHARGPIQLRLVRNQSLICEVSDSSAAAPHLRRAGRMDEGGRGLFLIAQLSRRWGTRYSGDRKTIWAEQPLNGPRR
ncbi:SpoIIE family protein phosphatase [Streptomyces botrytidirepellens]|uniref:PAS domain S-box protein n=1 Tax=Streptomyces botrytidirepellens TaxID=2486417 RepID=A0A3M8VYP9_9ACTN|nr:SpoIIE family protein phosphatase [Streptomyces botrytidirepellens]RNG22460.1 PAS domain S-box protein [Streptomyces botrytidirepellens]